MTADLLSRLQSALAGHYVVERELGRGGMATVYLAQDLRHDRPVALKVLHAELAQTLGPWHLHRATLSEQLGARAQAIEDYQMVAGLWRDPDPELRPLRDEARAALARLTAERTQ